VHVAASALDGVAGADVHDLLDLLVSLSVLRVEQRRAGAGLGDQIAEDLLVDRRSGPREPIANAVGADAKDAMPASTGAAASIPAAQASAPANLDGLDHPTVEGSHPAGRTAVDRPILASAETPAQATRSPVPTVADQILDSVHASMTRGEKQMVVRLHPPELGSVVMRFREEEARVSATLEVMKSETRQEIERALPQVVRGLEQAGVQFRRIEVVAPEPQDRDFSRGQFQQEPWTQHQGEDQPREDRAHARPDAGGPRNAAGRPGSDPYAHSDDSPPSPTPQGRIDMLL
jgi:flagellar hook-length control protein FliK